MDCRHAAQWLVTLTTGRPDRVRGELAWISGPIMAPPDESAPYPAQRRRRVAIMTEILQIVGAILVLAGFAAAQLGRVDATSVPYLVTNLVGAGLLAAVAVIGRDWGCLLLEGVWAVVSLISLIKVWGRPATGAPPGAATGPR